MKTWIAVFLSCISCHAGTWILHGFSDNFLECSWQQDAFNGSPVLAYAEWDLAFDQAFPQWSDSGVSYDDATTWTGYSDVLTVTVPDGVILSTVTIGLGYPYYSSPGVDGRFLFWNGDQPQILTFPGEYWIDIPAGGFGIRVSLFAPSDFGKWAWDGSINPNYVSPLAPKKHHGKK